MTRSSLRHFLARLAIAFVLVVATTSAGVVAGDAVFERAYNESEAIPIDEGVLDENEESEPANFLVVGSDTRSIVDDEGEAGAFGSPDEVSGERSDTLMVVHVEPRSRTGFVVSFPRDLRVEIPDHGTSRINAAYGLGGPELVIETLRENFSIPIHHYLEVDFDGFREIVETIGGVDIWFPTPARDELSGLHVPDAGCRELDGNAALAYTRSRFYQWFDTDAERWRDDPRSDLSRIERQQYFLRSLADTALDRGARSPLTAYNLVTRVFDYVGRDPQLELDDLKGLINAFRDLDPASVEMVTIPSEAGPNGMLVVREAEAEPILTRLQFRPFVATLPEPVPPSQIEVRVLNGSGVRGRAAEVLEALEAHGYERAGRPEDAARDDYALTQVRYAPGATAKGLTVGGALATANVLEAREPLPGGADVEVIVGADWEDLDAPVKQPPEPSVPTTTGDTAATTTTTAPSPSPSQTAVVPVDPETGGPLVGCP